MRSATIKVSVGYNLYPWGYQYPGAKLFPTLIEMYHFSFIWQIKVSSNFFMKIVLPPFNISLICKNEIHSRIGRIDLSSFTMHAFYLLGFDEEWKTILKT